jgi:DNA-binding response OmpR family regulator/Flp pilus assembly protein TadD
MFSVLLIDDEPDIRDVFRLMAERSGEMTIESVRTAEEGLRIIRDKSFDAIIVDYDIPDINGIQFLKILRSQRDTTPVIFFTGAGREHTAIEALNSGANFYLKKADDPPHMQYRQLVSMVKSAVEGNYLGRPLGTARRIIEDMIQFTSDPSFAIDRENTVIAWNESLEQLTDTLASDFIGKRDLAYAEPFFGKKRKTLLDLVFAPDEEIKKEKYMLISRVPKGPVIAVTRGQRKDGREWTLWTKAMPLFDGFGNFIAVTGIVRDVTTTFSDVVIRDSEAETLLENVSGKPDPAAASSGGLMDKILGKAQAHYREGAVFMVRDRKYPEAIAAFDQALKIDEMLAYAWSDRGICYRETGDHTTALKSCLRAVECAPENTECLFTLGETLEKIGLLYMNNKYLDSAIQVLKMVVNQMPNNMSAWNHLGICYKEMGKHEESKFYFDRARDIHLWNKDTPVRFKRNEYV